MMLDIGRIPFHPIPKVRSVESLQEGLSSIISQAGVKFEAHPSSHQPGIVNIVIEKSVKKLCLNNTITFSDGHCVYQQKKIIIVILSLFGHFK